MALAGGATIQVPQPQGYWYQPEGIASPDGHCRPFDAQAQGTIFGSGVGVVVLKRLEDALAARDHIYAVIRGSAINNDGSLKVGYTAPSVDGQADAIAEAQAIAGVEPETISYIEAHGTATGMGDPIEVAALTQVFRAETDQTGFCALGSVKGNIGHLNRAAGVIGLIKTTLALQHQQLPPSLHFEQPNPQIDFDQSPFYVNTHLQPWQTPGFPRRAGVSSFGIGGTNAHAVLEEAPATPSAEPPPRPHPRRLRAGQTGTARGAAPPNLARHLRQHPDVGLADVAFTLQTGRQAFQHRRILVCETCDQAIASLSAPPPSRSLTQASSPSVVFMFSGQGAQYVNMAHDLYQHEPVFRAHVDRCAQLLQPDLKVDLCQLLYPSPDQAESATQQLKQTALTQPALFVVEYALAQLWITWGVQPQAMIGHSIGEYVAACLSGVFSLEDALVLVTKRGQMMQSLPQGSMLAVFLPPDQISSLLTPDLSLATHNSPTVSAVSGPDAAIDALETQLQAQAIDCRRIHTSHAFHSQMMEPILGDFAALVGKSSLNPPQIPFVSNVTGTWITAAEATDPSYWAQHIRQTVRFADGVNLLCQDPDQILLEVGPGKSLCSLVKQNPFAFWKTILSSARHPKEDISDVAFVLQTLGQLWLAGLSVDWAKLYAPQSRQRLPLPTYPFERQRYWVDPQPQPTIQPLSHAANLSTQLTQLLEQSDQFSDQERTLLHKLLSRLDPSSQPVVDPEEMSAGNPDWFYQLAWQPTPHTVKGNASVNASVN
ncbi:MAG: type I polyketide synthase, partial [Cyanobacteria bacterium P01_F01_bin.4]